MFEDDVAVIKMSMEEENERLGQWKTSLEGKELR